MILPSESPGVVAYAASDLRVEPVPLREPAANETVVEVAYGGICGSDLHYWMHGAAGESILRAPMVLGHEASAPWFNRHATAAAPEQAPWWRSIRPPLPATASLGFLLIDRISHRPAPTLAAPPGSRIATGRS
jgi:hypothetical protein